ncbi:MAG TPA: hypothetical protein VLB85_15900, partial [Acidimicrobiia bacterium]|nr:hypothetical protein [Acidimicrobiia bacterium]
DHCLVGWRPAPVDGIAMTVLLTTAFAAGMISTVNPCGFAMLPAYLGYFLGGAPGTDPEPCGLAAPSGPVSWGCSPSPGW